MFGVFILLTSSVGTLRSFQRAQQINAESIALQKTTNIASRLTFHAEKLQGALEVAIYADGAERRKRLLRKTIEPDREERKSIGALSKSMVGSAGKICADHLTAARKAFSFAEIQILAHLFANQTKAQTIHEGALHQYFHSHFVVKSHITSQGGFFSWLSTIVSKKSFRTNWASRRKK
ncbi:MAG: hypothetical protein M1313_02300 [Nitrospirae bacterium]|nr:hypothetical protein [Nitrospirota bacterium]